MFCVLRGRDISGRGAADKGKCVYGVGLAGRESGSRTEDSVCGGEREGGGKRF